ncbi:hypothetical protein O6H91_02G021500 [Diphasiastrum complanatum]|uniref:Uncharacterized protein n=1 Tax=Diphasiastrum complanatum TaxID=34168 RepID=A0ACC2ED87_DIPCM|nr:hypothetical protein O6H91_02G021500 [Diphasiastrum complanatum]
MSFIAQSERTCHMYFDLQKSIIWPSSGYYDTWQFFISSVPRFRIIPALFLEQLGHWQISRAFFSSPGGSPSLFYICNSIPSKQLLALLMKAIISVVSSTSPIPSYMSQKVCILLLFHSLCSCLQERKNRSSVSACSGVGIALLSFFFLAEKRMYSMYCSAVIAAFL